ncbi:agouti-related protein [Pogona vitticeps]|uniref:Agouti-related protein n=1 Tax=Pogona vitticeps TaxID=103695 RepID=A0A6J0U2H1_9SAUR|nr:agouti-related protein [Pogona vitticeps]
MLRMLLLSFGLLQGIPGLLASSPNHLDERGSILYEAGQSSYPSLLQMVREVPPPDFDRLALEMPVAQDDHVADISVMEQQGAPGPREERSPPRRCVRLQESCLGHRLPCCDPCATCYCRFFNANCFCKRLSNAFPCGRN